MKALLFSLGLVLAACGGKSQTASFPFEASSVTPGAMGEVVTRTDANGNTRLSIDVQHLAPPDRVAPGATVYVVWVTDVAAGATPQNLGALRVDKDLRGKLEVATPLRTFDLTITAEPSPGVVAPSGPPVLKVRVTSRS
jgi:hypothetical protein